MEPSPGADSTAEQPKQLAQTLVGRLRQQYAERWAVLLDALFASPPASSAALHNRFVSAKAHGEPLLAAGEVTLARAPEPAAASRHTASGLLTHFLASPASVLPALALAPSPDSSLLILGSPPAGRLLALTQQLFGHTAPSEPGSPSRRSRGRSLSAALEQSPAPDGATQQAEAEPDSPPAVQPALPGFIYGERPLDSCEPEAPSRAALPGLPSAAAASASDGQQLHWGGLGALLEGLMLRGAGCCTVRTSSGDWAELAEAAAAAAQPSGAEPEGGTELSRLAPGGPGSGRLECAAMPPQRAVQLGRLLRHHVPEPVRARIRLVTEEGAAAPDPGGSYGSDSYEAVVVEAQATASAAAVVAACQAGAAAAAWPSPEEAALITRQAQLLLAGFQALRPGGLLLLCSGSLAWEETEGLVAACCARLGASAAVLQEPPGGGGGELAVALKRFGAERCERGWRLLPDLSLEGPAYFSLLRKRALAAQGGGA